MKRIGNLWGQITTFGNLYQAYRQARRGKGTRSTVTRFELDLEGNLFELQERLQTRRYRPGEYHLFTIYDRKPRTIAAAPFADRVVHHALMNLVEPVLDRRFISDCYACRVGKGVHAAVRRYQAWARRYPYVLKVDVRQYFPSIDHNILKTKLRRRIKDRNVLWLFDTIIDSAPQAHSPGRFFPGDDLLVLMERRCGVPIGNLTSQFLCFTLGNRVGWRPGVWFAAVAGTTNQGTSGRRTGTGTPPMKRTTTLVFVSPGRLPQGSEPTHLRMRRAYPRVPMARFPVPRSGTRRPKSRARNAAPGAGRPDRRPWAFFKAVAALLLGSIGISLPLAAQDDSVSLPRSAFPTQPCRVQPGAGPELAVIAAGRFLMGSPADEPGRDSDEGPQHGVSLIAPFAIGRCEVTVGEFRAFIEATGYRTDAERGNGCRVLRNDGSGWESHRDRDWRNPGFPQTDRHPVVCVSWNDARAYAHWLGLRTGQRYRLPSAAEWEYAARGLRATKVPRPTLRRYWGKDPKDTQMCEFANGADLDVKARFPDRPWPTNNCRD
ncbi:SUMF1/EgtB/PvdO family nonheme iron enzyme, partial [Candidatus Thiosymbion oneisti]|uniref:SUMF1/EgtB/PvdO family nonheme iron enzyme n=1 Tax=Candidatus Thiosymbion oneisti TaxID=589554 RepID=UPI000AA72231